MSVNIPIYNQTGQEVDTMELNPDVFDVVIKPWLIQESIVAQQSAKRVPIAHTKDRGDVRGGGKKPWKQKGTGRARHGSIRSPLWRGGGVVFGPTNSRNFLKKINKKIKRQALLMALTEKAKSQSLKVIDTLAIPQIKTKLIKELLNTFSLGDKKILMALDTAESSFIKSARNIPAIKLIAVNSLNTLDIVASEILLTTKEGIKIVEKTYGKRQ